MIHPLLDQNTHRNLFQNMNQQSLMGIFDNSHEKWTWRYQVFSRFSEVRKLEAKSDEFSSEKAVRNFFQSHRRKTVSNSNFSLKYFPNRYENDIPCSAEIFQTSTRIKVGSLHSRTWCSRELFSNTSIWKSEIQGFDSKIFRIIYEKRRSLAFRRISKLWVDDSSMDD